MSVFVIMKKLKFMALILCLTAFGFDSILADDLKRRASWEARLSKSAEPGMIVKKVEQGSPLAKAGVKVGDTLLSIDGIPILSQEQWFDLTDALVASREYQLLFISKDSLDVRNIKVTFKPFPFEKHPNISTLYESFTSDYGIKQRAIITRPKANKKLPAILVLQGLSCSSIEKLPNRKSNFIRLLNDLVEKSGMVVMRVEKPGMGDSEGNCSETDFKTELNGYEKAVQLLKAKDYVDSSKIIVYGNSMGSALAPYMANKYNLAGVISDGTYMRTWFEHMLEIERRIREIQGDDQSTITKKMIQAYIPLYYGMLVEKRSYEDLITENPLLGEYNYHGLNHMYGRPMAFYHQLQDFDIAGEWQKLKVPARIRWGTNDWIMSEYDNDLIVSVLESVGHEDHILYKYPKMDHWLTLHENYSDSFNFKPGKWEEKISQQVIDWAKEIVQ